MERLLEVRGLETEFSSREGVVHAVNGVSLYLDQGETLGIVGESGSGKSVTVMSMLRLIPAPPGRITAGSACFQGRDLLQMSDEDIRQVRGTHINMVFQDPMTSLNPVMTIGRQVTEPLEKLGVGKRQAEDQAVRMLEMVGIANARDHLNSYPHQFSGGMRQRVMVAMALITSPKILVADEPTTALDVTIQAQIVELVKQLRDELGMAMIWITHDLGIIAELADRVAVMYGGLVVEEAAVGELFANPRHPYTIGLLGSLPRLDGGGNRRLTAIDGLPPVLLQKPASCPFAQRCAYAVPRCLQENPSLAEVNPAHRTACWVNPSPGKETA
ncbi:MAG: peptide/nickel transport system ATP-binding protein [Chloroflexota bacterium]|nr:peptide/nickel transport system ATP-binding protein [Chloroflexota bacterium]